MSIADMQRFAELRRGGDATMADRLALLREHHAQLDERIHRLRASGRALDEKITHYEKSLGEQ